MAGMAVVLRGWLPHRGEAQMAYNYCFPTKDNVLNKFRIVKERHFQMRKPYQSPGQDEKLILLYCPGRGLNSRPPAHRSFKHGQGVPLGHGGGQLVASAAYLFELVSTWPSMLYHEGVFFSFNE